MQLPNLQIDKYLHISSQPLKVQIGANAPLFVEMDVKIRIHSAIDKG